MTPRAPHRSHALRRIFARFRGPASTSAPRRVDSWIDERGQKYLWIPRSVIKHMFENPPDPTSAINSFCVLGWRPGNVDEEPVRKGGPKLQLYCWILSPSPTGGLWLRFIDRRSSNIQYGNWLLNGKAKLTLHPNSPGKELGQRVSRRMELRSLRRGRQIAMVDLATLK